MASSAALTAAAALDHLAPWANPPAETRVRAIKVATDNGLFQVLAPEAALIDVDAVALALGGNLTVLDVDPRQPTSAVPGYYEIPLLIDQALPGRAEIALATDRPGAWLRCCGDDLLASGWSYDVCAFAVAVPPNPTPAERDRDIQLINDSVSRFTELKLQQRIDETLEIPPLPEAARRIIALKNDPNYDLSDLVAVIESDPALAARIVGWANSAYYNADPAARSIQDAVMRILGFDLVFNMALGMALGDTLRLPKQDVDGLPPFWIQSLFCAATMEALTRQMPPDDRPEPGLAYLAGLLANFGQLVIGQVFPYQYDKILTLQSANRHLSHTYADQMVLGVTREVLASTLLETWELDQGVCDAVRFQHLSEYVGSNASLVNLLHLTHQTLSFEGVNDCPPQVPDADLVEWLKLDTSRIDAVLEVLAESRESIEELAAMMAPAA